jgi:hypothetical protein
MARRTAGILFVAFLVLYLLTMGGHLYSPDEEVLFRTTQAIAERGSLAIKPLAGFATRRGKDRDSDYEYAQYGVGQPLLAVPFYILGRTLAKSFEGHPSSAALRQWHDGSPEAEWQRFGVSLFNQVVAALLVALLFSLAYDLTGDRRASILTAVLYGAGTMAWVHSKPFFTETLATLLIFSSYSLLVRARLYRQPRWVMIAGAVAGYALLTRLDSLLAFPGLAVLLLWPDRKALVLRPGGEDEHATEPIVTGWHAAWDRLMRFAPPVALACLIILGLNWVRYGAVFETGYGDQPEGINFGSPLLVGLYGLLLSVGRGLLLFSPPLILFFWSVGRFVKQWPAAGWALVVLVLSVLLVHAKWVNWAGGWCWGPRHVFMLHVFLALPVCALLSWRWTPVVRIAYGVMLAIGIGVQLLGTSQNFIDYYYVAFRNPYILPNAMVRYNQGEDSVQISYYEVRFVKNPFDPKSESVPSAPWQMLAPITDSVWRIENSAWSMYPAMWRQGFHDYFWLETLNLRRSKANLERPKVEAELKAIEAAEKEAAKRMFGVNPAR